MRNVSNIHDKNKTGLQRISIILKLVHPLTKRLRSRFVWSRGRCYHIMAKLDPVKISWIISQKENGTSNSEIVHSMKISARWIQELYSRYNSTGIIPAPRQSGRPKKQITEQEASIVVSAFEKYRRCAVFLECFRENSVLTKMVI